MGLFYEVAEGVLKKPRSVSRRVLSERPTGLSEGLYPMRKKRYAGQMPWEDYSSTSEGVVRTVERESGQVQRATKRSRDIITEGKTESFDEDVVLNPRSEQESNYFKDTRTGLIHEPSTWKPGSFRDKTYKNPERQALRSEVSYARAKAAFKSRDELYPTSEITDYRSGLSGSSGSKNTWEEPPTFREKVQVTDTQWQRYLQRISDRTPSGQTRSTTSPAPGPRPNLFQRTDNPIAQGDTAATEAMNTMQPQVPTTDYGRLVKGEVKFGQGKTPGRVFDDPVDQSIDKYIESHEQLGGPGDLKPYSRTDLPNARTLNINKEGQATYEERHYNPKFGDRVDNAVDIFKKAGPALTKSAKWQKETGQEPTPIKEVIKKLMLLDDLWTQVGGRRSLTGKKWDTFRKSAPGRYKVDDAKDFFLSVGIKWLERPSSVDKRHAKALEDMWQSMKEM